MATRSDTSLTLLQRVMGNDDRRMGSHRESLARPEKVALVTRPMFSLGSDDSEANGQWEDIDGGGLPMDSQEALRGRTEPPFDHQGTRSNLDRVDS